MSDKHTAQPIICVLSIILSTTCLHGTLATDSLQSDQRPLNVLWPCTYRHDVNHDKGLVVDCRHLGLNIINSTWFPSSSTEILLDNNQLSSLDNSIFELTNDLRVLSLCFNKLSNIVSGTLSGLDKLEYLDLEYNLVNVDAFGEDVFRDLGNLTTLKLAHTFVGLSPQKWHPPCLLKYLNNLKYLSLSIPAGELQFGELFANGSSLIELYLTGDETVSIKNESFKMFADIPLQRLTFQNMYHLSSIEIDAFRYLTELHYLNFTDTYEGISQDLNSLYPFQHRNFTALIFDRLSLKKEASLYHNSIQAGDGLNYLSSICVKRISFSYSITLSLELKAILSPTLQQCLEELHMAGVPLLKFDSSYVSLFSKMIALKSVKIQYAQYPEFSIRSPRKFNLQNTIDCKNLSKPCDLNHKSSGDDLHTGIPTVIIDLSPNLEQFTFTECKGSSNSLNKRYIVTQGRNLRYVDFSDSKYVDVSGTIQGLGNMEYIDLSYNKIQRLNPKFFYPFTKLKNLKLKRININETFMLQYGSKLFSKLNSLEYLDFSSNDLISIPKNTFNGCSKLKELNLSYNKLSYLTIDLSIFKSLKLLNVASNAIITLSQSYLHSLDQYRQRQLNFTVYLNGNPFSCDCSNLHFLLWLNRTSVTLDKDGNYRCLSGDGVFVTTHSLTRNLEAMWRKCNGQYAFFLSLVLWLMYILTLVLIFAINHFKTFLVYAVFHLFAPNYKLKKKDDYQYGVFLGYEDSDYRFACFELRRFLEDQLKVTTYIRDRDLLPASDMAESIADSINASWRVVFIVSPSFLRLESWNYFTVKSAIYSVSPFNPKKIVLLADKDIVHRIPDSLLKVIPEDNIIEMEMPFGLAYEEQEALKNVIL